MRFAYYSLTVLIWLCLLLTLLCPELWARCWRPEIDLVVFAVDSVVSGDVSQMLTPWDWFGCVCCWLCCVRRCEPDVDVLRLIWLSSLLIVLCPELWASFDCHLLTCVSSWDDSLRLSGRQIKNQSLFLSPSPPPQTCPDSGVRNTSIDVDCQTIPDTLIRTF